METVSSVGGGLEFESWAAMSCPSDRVSDVDARQDGLATFYEGSAGSGFVSNSW